MGDTNLVMAECVSGTRTADIVKILYNTGNGDGLWEISLKEKDGGFLILANVSCSALHKQGLCGAGIGAEGQAAAWGRHPL